VALAVIIVLYLGIGVLSAAGSVALSRRLLPANAEQVCFALILAPIALVYLAFAAYYGANEAWRLEAVAALVFAGLGIVGMRVAVVLILGYSLHGAWDLVHELYSHAGLRFVGTRTLSELPLAYGVFCATYDWCMAVYFFTRRTQWDAAWRERAK
jgi:hypothetical protein